MQPHVSIVILAWNHAEDVLECLASVRNLDYANHQILVVDNASTDDTVARIRAQFPEAHLIVNETNLGFVEGNNVGIRYALEHDAAYIFLLNDDTVLASSNLISELVRVGERDARIGMLTPSIVSYHDHTKQYWGAHLDWTHGTGIEDDRPVNEVNDTDFAQGCALLVKASVVRQIGLLDLAYWAYFEDADWNLRCQRAGYRTVIVPQVQIYHKGTSDQNAQKSARAFYFFRRNQLFFMRRYAGFVNWLRFLRVYTRDCVLHYQQLLRENQSDQARASVDGWWAGLRGQFGARRVTAPAWFRVLIDRYGAWLIAFVAPREWLMQRWYLWKQNKLNN